MSIIVSNCLVASRQSLRENVYLLYEFTVIRQSERLFPDILDILLRLVWVKADKSVLFANVRTSLLLWPVERVKIVALRDGGENVLVWRGLAIKIWSSTSMNLFYFISTARTTVLCVHFLLLLLIIVTIIISILNLALQVLDSSFMNLLPCVSGGLNIFQAVKWRSLAEYKHLVLMCSRILVISNFGRVSVAHESGVSFWEILSLLLDKLHISLLFW